jgi:hypothetical protein
MSGDASGNLGQKRRIWAKPIFWLAGIIVAAVGIAITNTIVPRLTQAFDVLSEGGDPIRVNDVHTYWSSETAYSVVFPADMPVTDSMLSTVNGLDGIEPQVDWLIANGASAADRVYITVAVVGNRKDGVRIVDVRPIAKCSPPLTGTLFYAPPQGRDTSIRLQFDLDKGDRKPTYRNASGDVEPFFPENTISLKKDEEQILQVDVGTKNQSCDFTLELTVLEGNERKKQTVNKQGGKPFQVSGITKFSAYNEIYTWGGWCEGKSQGDRWVRSPKPYEDYPRCP